MKRQARINFNADMTVDINLLRFELKKPDLDYPDDIGGTYYFDLSPKEKKLYRLANPSFVLSHAYDKKILNLSVEETAQI